MNRETILELHDLLGGGAVQTSAINVYIPCPFAAFSADHKSDVDHKPGFSVRIEPDGPSVCHCHTCKQGGLLLRTIERLRRLDPDAQAALDFTRENDRPDLRRTFARILRESPGAGPPDPEPEEEAVRQLQLVRFVKACQALLPEDFLAARRLARWDAEQWSLGFDPSQGRVTFPHWDGEGRLVGLQGRAWADGVEPKYRHYNSEFQYDPNPCFYGEHRIDRAWRSIILVEGPMDVIRLTKYGHRNTLSMFGTPTPSGARLAKLLEWGRTVVVLFDSDEPGTSAASKVAAHLSTKGIATYIATLPRLRSDADSATRREVQEALQAKEFFA